MTLCKVSFLWAAKVRQFSIKLNEKVLTITVCTIGSITFCLTGDLLCVLLQKTEYCPADRNVKAYPYRGTVILSKLYSRVLHDSH